MNEENEEETKTTEEEQAETTETAEEAETEIVTKKEEEEGKETPEATVEAETKEEMPAPGEEEEKAKPPSREKKEEEEVVEERIYTIPLGKALIMPPRKRAPRAMRMLRSFIIKHMKLEAPKAEGEEEEEPKELSISNEVNERLWGRGVERPPRKIRVRAAKDKDGNVTVYLAEGD